MPEFLGHNGAAAWVEILLDVLARRIAGEHDLVAGGMARVRVVQAADDRILVLDLRRHRQQVTNLDARDAGAHRTERATIILRCVGFGIPCLMLAGTAAHQG